MVGSAGFSTITGSGLEGLRLSSSPAHIRGPPCLQLPLLTLGSLGTQIVWSVEMAYGTPYLLELGLSKAAMAAVYTAGPIAGLVVQPVIGLLADRSTHRWGRRRPYLAASCLGCSLFVLLLGYARVLTDLFGLPDAVLPLTVLAIWGLDFSVNAVMALNRALLFDVLPAEQQADGNAWLARLCSIGSILGFFVGDLDLPATFPFSWLPSLSSHTAMAPSEHQVRCLSLLTVSFILCTNALVLWAVVEQRLERVPGHRSPDGPALKAHKRNPLCIAVSTVREFWRTAQMLSDPIRDVLRIQTFSWICWFPLMFYSTEWISSVAVAGYLEDLRKGGQVAPTDMKKLKARGTRAGSHAMFLQAVVAFGFSLVLPLLLPSPGSDEDDQRRPSFMSGLASTLPQASTSAARDVRRTPLPAHWLRDRCGGVRLTTLWVVAHFAIAVITWMTWPVAASKSVGMATLLIAVAGYSWSVTVWGPYSLLGIFIQSGLAQQEQGSAAGAGAYQSVPLSESWSFNSSMGANESDPTAEGSHPASGSAQPRIGLDFDRSLSIGSVNGIGSRSGHTAANEDEAEETRLFFDATLTTASAPAPSSVHGASGGSHQAGTILGVHNTAIVIPQLLVSLLASLIFAVYDNDSRYGSTSQRPSEGKAELPKQQQGDAIGLVFRLGGVASIVAGVYTMRLGRQWGDIIAGATGSGDGGGGAAGGGSQRRR